MLCCTSTGEGLLKPHQLLQKSRLSAANASKLEAACERVAYLIALFKVLLQVHHIVMVQSTQYVNLLEDVFPAEHDSKQLLRHMHLYKSACRLFPLATYVHSTGHTSCCPVPSAAAPYCGEVHHVAYRCPPDIRHHLPSILVISWLYSCWWQCHDFDCILLACLLVCCKLDNGKTCRATALQNIKHVECAQT